MMKYLLAGAALAVIATPAAARDNSAYFGIEVGPMFANDSDVELNNDNFAKIDHKIGVDGDLIAGYDFGLFRAELEGAYKWAQHGDIDFAGVDIDDADGHTRAYSLMGNAMVDFGNNERMNFYIGAGAGIAWVHQKFDISDVPADPEGELAEANFAWQIIAGVRAPVWNHFDLGLKYRYFNGGKISDDFDEDTFHSDFRTHSLLASLIYNFGPPEAPVIAPPPPPPPPPPPATQTCPDGTVILATDSCPLPPPPPPPPPPEPVRGY